MSEIVGRGSKVDKFIDARARGVSVSAAGRLVGISYTRALQWDSTYASEVTGLREAMREELIAKYRVGAEARIKRLGQEVERMSRELSQRDYSEVATGELLRLYLRALGQVRAEVEPRGVDASGDSMKLYLNFMNKIVMRPGDDAAVDTTVVDAEVVGGDGELTAAAEDRQG